ncbi:unnamed protein product [Miscanthus lutarioriparius]|uniref:Small ribosomal subunit protein mS23 n=1 Tax=Miscanthus lutarioriparius TaxID=422564 RepID=A0A811RLP0_9POAL|nr:unnamed protein product [Miscanthus lutarioriparius]
MPRRPASLWRRHRFLPLQQAAARSRCRLPPRLRGRVAAGVVVVETGEGGRAGRTKREAAGVEMRRREVGPRGDWDRPGRREQHPEPEGGGHRHGCRRALLLQRKRTGVEELLGFPRWVSAMGSQAPCQQWARLGLIFCGPFTCTHLHPASETCHPFHFVAVRLCGGGGGEASARLPDLSDGEEPPQRSGSSEMSYICGGPADEDAEAGEGTCQARAQVAQGHGRVGALATPTSVFPSLAVPLHLHFSIGRSIRDAVRWRLFIRAPPVTFPRPEGKIKKIEFPEDVYVRKFNKKHPDSLYHDAIKISGFDPPPARVFAWRVLELKEQGVSEDDAVAVADMEYRTQKKAKKKAYKELKEIARSEGKKPPPNPYPSAIKEIQAEEKKYVMDRLFNPKVIEIANKMKEERDKLRQDRAAGQW